MFHSARLSLTAWYLFIIMSVSMLFSLIIYSETNRELNRFSRFQQVRIEHEGNDFLLPSGPVRIRVFDKSMIDQARMRLILTLIGINFGILGISAILGFLLAGRTLRPIKEMVDEQNRFITDASHELRTPLTAIRIASEVNLRNKNLSLSDAKKLLEGNLEDVIYLETLINDLMRFMQYEKGSKFTTFEKTNLGEVLTEAKNKVAILAAQKGVSIELPEKKLAIDADKKSLIELFLIFLDNAIKYSHEKSTVKVTIERKTKEVAISIKDQGIGIHEETLPYIFDRFYRVERSRSKDVVPGYGLGLSIARRIIDVHNGSVEVVSQEKKGTVFTVILPLKQSMS